MVRRIAPALGVAQEKRGRCTLLKGGLGFAPMRRTQGAMLCPRCSKLISVSARECPFCGAHRPGLWGFGPAIAKPFGGRLDPVFLIPVICITMYLLALALDLRAALDFRNTFLGLLS